MSIMRVVIPAFLAVCLGGAALAQEAPLTKVYACAGLTKADERLACYDAAVAGLKQAEASGGVAVVSKEQIAAAEKQSFGRAAPSLSEVTGNVALAAPPEPLDRIDATIVSVTKRLNGLLRFTLADGQVWEEYDKSLGRLPELPLKAEIRKATFGSFMIKVENKSLVRVRRVS